MSVSARNWRSVNRAGHADRSAPVDQTRRYVGGMSDAVAKPTTRGPEGSADPAPRSAPKARRTARDLVFGGGILRVEVGYAALLVSAFVLPHWMSFRAWVPCLALAIALAVGHAVSKRNPLTIPWPIAAYLAVYAAAAIHGLGGQLNPIDAGRYFAPPLLALAFAWASTDARTRSRLVLLALAAVAVQIPVALGQTVNLVADLGEAAVTGVDSVAGLLGSEQAGTLGICGLFAAALAIAAGYLGAIRLSWGLVLGLALVSLSLWSSTRISYAFAPLTLAAVGLSAVALGRRLFPKRTLVTAAAVTVLAAPLLYLGMDALYPGANQDFANVSALESQLRLDQERAAENEANDGRRDPPQVDESSVTATYTLLPNRGRQLELALRYSSREGLPTMLLGRGLGATTYKDEGVLDATGSTADELTSRVQQTRGIWIARVISEAGYVGLLAFFGLLTYMVAIAWRNRALLPLRNWDGVVVLALPALALVTLMAAFYMPALTSQPFASLVWPLIGVGIAIDAGRRRTSPPA